MIILGCIIFYPVREENTLDSQYSQMPQIHTVFLGMGANIGERQHNLARALQQLATIVTIQKVSSLYETEPVGYLDQPPFLNLACQGSTTLDPVSLLTALKEIETQMGRLPSFRNAPRPIDIDILLYNQLQVQLPQLTIPHPRMHERAFVLIPLAEIAPLVIEPTSGQTIQHLATQISTKGVLLTPFTLGQENSTSQ